MKRKKASKWPWIAGITIVAIVLAAFFIYRWNSAKNASAKSRKNSNSPYFAFALGRVDVDGGIVKLSASKDGVLSELLVEEGEKVKKGQILCRLDDRKEKLNWEYYKSQANLALKKIEPLKVSLEAAQREQNRNLNLLKNEAISQQAMDNLNDTVNRLTAELKVAEAEAEVALAQQRQSEYDMELKKIRAPANGRILRCDARPGYGISTLNVTVLFLFVPDSPFIIRAEVEEKFLQGIKPGTKVDIIPDSDENKLYMGKVLKIGNYLGPKRMSFDDPQEKNDVRTIECILTVYEKNLLLGQRVLVKFKK